MSEQEKYVPSEEEVSKAEDVIAADYLTPTQSKLTEDREAKEPLRQRHRDLNPEKREKGDGQPESIDFNEGGHKFFIKKYTRDGGFFVTIDGSIFVDETTGVSGIEDHELARMLWEKYASEIAQTEQAFESDTGDIRKAKEEVEMTDFMIKHREAQKRKAVKQRKIIRELLGISG